MDPHNENIQSFDDMTQSTNPGSQVVDNDSIFHSKMMVFDKIIQQRKNLEEVLCEARREVCDIEDQVINLKKKRDEQKHAIHLYDETIHNLTANIAKEQDLTTIDFKDFNERIMKISETDLPLVTRYMNSDLLHYEQMLTNVLNEPLPEEIDNFYKIEIKNYSEHITSVKNICNEIQNTIRMTNEDKSVEDKIIMVDNLEHATLLEQLEMVEAEYKKLQSDT